MVGDVGLLLAMVVMSGTPLPTPSPSSTVNVAGIFQERTGDSSEVLLDAESAHTDQYTVDESSGGVGGSQSGSRDYGVWAPQDGGFEYESLSQICLQTDAEPLRPNGVVCDPLPVAGSTQGEDDETAEDELEEFVTVTAADFVKLPLNGSGIQVQPSWGWVLVNKDTIAFTVDDPQVLTTEVLGHPVVVRATPVEFAWNFGQGSQPFTTDYPGASYPDHTVAYAYTARSNAESVQLITTWVGEFQVNGQGPWLPIAGTAQTTSESSPFEVREVRTRLVPGPGNG